MHSAWSSWWRVNSVLLSKVTDWRHGAGKGPRRWPRSWAIGAAAFPGGQIASSRREWH